MARTQYQPGPATDHYHDTIGVTREAPLASAPVIEIGPFEINWDDAGIGGTNGVAVTDLPEGTTVYRAWASVTTAWNSDSQDGLLVYVADASDASQKFLVYTRSCDDVGAEAGAIVDIDADSFTARPAHATVPCQLRIRVSSVGAPLADQGQLLVYALISQPA